MLLNHSQIYNTQLKTDLLSAAQSVHYSESNAFLYFKWQYNLVPINIAEQIVQNNIHVYKSEQEQYILTNNNWNPPLST